MKKLFLSVLIILSGKLLLAQYKPVDNGSSIQFKIKNFGINTNGSFSGLQGNIRYDAGHPNDAVFDVTIDASKVNTANDMRDDHLRSDTYFDVKKYPLIRFVSTKVTTVNGTLTVAGKLTIKDQTRDISFPFTVTPANDGLLFKGTFNINRKDFGVGGASVISNNLEVSLSILAKK